MPTVEQLQAMVDPLLPGTLGMKLQSASTERVVATMKVRADLCTGGHILHGGAYMAFADTIGALGTVMNLPKGTRTATIESKTNFFAGAPEGSTVTGESTPLHIGRTTMAWVTRITREDGKLCAVVTQTQMVIPVEPKG